MEDYKTADIEELEKEYAALLAEHSKLSLALARKKLDMALLRHGSRNGTAEALVSVIAQDVIEKEQQSIDDMARQVLDEIVAVKWELHARGRR